MPVSICQISVSATSLLAHADLADSAEAGVNETFAICVRNLYSAYANPADARGNALPRAGGRHQAGHYTDTGDAHLRGIYSAAPLLSAAALLCNSD